MQKLGNRAETVKIIVSSLLSVQTLSARSVKAQVLNSATSEKFNASIRGVVEWFF